MRKIYLDLLIIGLCIAFAAPIKAQAHIDVNINISSQPVWGPVGYDVVQYYYIPDIDTYYYVPRHQFIYQERGRWIKSSRLPPLYSNYDLYSGHKVVLNEINPYLHDNEYKEKYGSYKNRHDQHAIRDSRDSKYFANKNHPEHKNWVERQKNNNDQEKRQNNAKKNKGNDKKEGHGNQRNRDRH